MIWNYINVFLESSIDGIHLADKKLIMCQCYQLLIIHPLQEQYRILLRFFPKLRI